MAGPTKPTGGAAAVRRKQLLLMGALAGVVVAIAISASMLGGPPPAPPVEKKDAVVHKQFGAQGERAPHEDAWRTKEGARVTALEMELAELRKRTEAEAAASKRNEEDRRKADEERRNIEEGKRIEAERRAATQPPAAALPPRGAPAAGVPGRTAAQLGPAPMVSNGPMGATAVDPGTGMPHAIAPMAPARGITRVDFGKDSPAGGPAATPRGGATKPGAGQSQPNAGTGPGSQVDGSKTTDNYLPAGSFFKAVALSGLDAPTGGQIQTNPHPILFRVTDFAQLPNRFKADYKECFVTGNGHGDLSSERALIRIDRLACISEAGGAIDLAVKGYVAGPDGRAGVRGELVTKQGQALANAMAAGVLSGIGQAVVQTNTVTSTSALGSTSTVQSGKEFQTGAATGVGKAMDKLATFYIGLAEKMFPVVSIPSGTVVDIVLTQGIAIDR
jgi:conjugal transfer pilus assembly protein TraB